MIALLSGVALATPYWSALPAGTMPTGRSEFGGGVGYAALSGDLAGGFVVSGWGRYGGTERVEIAGGAAMPLLAPSLVAANGGVRFALLGQAQKPGPALSVGVMSGAALLAPGFTLSFSVPATVGFTAGPVQAWAGAAVTTYPMLSDLAGQPFTAPSGELGLAIDAGGYPVYLSGGVVGGPVSYATAMIGVGYVLE